MSKPLEAKLMFANAVILDSGRGTRRLDPTQSVPQALQAVDPHHTVLDWVLHALAASRVERLTYVGGYHIEKVVERYPQLSYRFHEGWWREGELAGLMLARPEPTGPCIVVRAETICTPEAIRRMAPDSAVVVGADGSGFVGIVAIPAQLVNRAFALVDDLVSKDGTFDLVDWISAASERELAVEHVELEGLAAPLHDEARVAKTVFGGKGKTLQQVAPLIRSARVLDQVRFTVLEWSTDRWAILERITREFGAGSVVIRSSAHAEDGVAESRAGEFRTILDVEPTDRTGLATAIDDVVASYRSSGRAIDARDEVFVQPQLRQLAASGVVLTRDLETGAPYYVVSVDCLSGRSDLVTSGGEGLVETFFVRRTARSVDLPPYVEQGIRLARELESLTHRDALDVEFGIDRAGSVYLFQVRPIGARSRRLQLADEDLLVETDHITEFLRAHLRPYPHLLGSSTLLGTMPDWNPVEMIGSSPRPLALSLYHRLVMTQAWAAARAEIGYRDVRPVPLMLSLGGRPYVDVRASLNSFLPHDLPAEIGAPWVDSCLGRLADWPALHDKLEFDVAITCLTFDFEEHAGRLREAGLDEGAVGGFRTRLLSLTDRMLTGAVAPEAGERSKLIELDRRRTEWGAVEADGIPALARRAGALLADCERLGVVPFSVLARYAFVALSFLRSLEAVGVLDADEHQELLSSVPTVASELSRDLGLHASNCLSTADFLARYGHLRPNSYDITSPNYRDAWESYGGGRPVRDMSGGSFGSPNAREILDGHAPEIRRLLREAGFSATFEQFRDFVLSSIPAREWAKFQFMKSVDAALETIAAIGRELDLSREDISFIPVEYILRSATESPTGAMRVEFMRAVNFHRKRWSLTCAIRLPHLIRSIENVDAFKLEEWTPNFISTKRIVAPAVLLDTGAPQESLDGRIVLIAAADPGFDWIFGHDIAGLVTQFGGVASHMAIRAAEFGLPAAIGCGELIFNGLRGARLIELDCASRKVRSLS